MNALVLGVGNDIKRDDAVGLRVTETLERRREDDALDFRTMTSGRIMLVEELRGYDRAFLIDAIKTESGDAGDWYRLEPGDVEPDEDSSGMATHDVGLGTLTRLGEAMGESMPEVTIFAIEAPEPFAFGDEMTEAMAETVPDLVDAIDAVIDEELPNPDDSVSTPAT
ncbi:MAG: hydrogenase maturation protease [Halobacteriales archaeon]|jgi:hydrogenase maturation protease